MNSEKQQEEYSKLIQLEKQERLSNNKLKCLEICTKIVNK